MEKVSVSKLEKEFNPDKEFRIEEVIDLTDTKSNIKTVRKLLSNFSNYDDMVDEYAEKLRKEQADLDKYKADVKTYEAELEDNGIEEIGERNVVGKLSALEKQLKVLEEEISLIKEDGNEPSEKKMDAKRALEREIAKQKNTKEVFENSLKYNKAELEKTEAKVEELTSKKDEFSKKTRESYYKIIKLTEFCVNEIKNAKKDLTKANKALKTFNNKNTEDFTKLSIKEQKEYSKKLYELHQSVIGAGENLEIARNKYLKILGTIANYANEEYPGLKASVDPIISKLDADSRKTMKDMDIVDVIEIEEPIEEKTPVVEETIEEVKEEAKEEPKVEKTEEEPVVEKEETEEKVEEEKPEAKTNLARAMESEKGKKITDVQPRRFFRTRADEMPERPDSMSISEYMSEWAKRIDSGEVKPAFVDESRIDEEHSWMNADQAKATGNLADKPKFIDNSVKKEEQTAIDKLIAKIKELNNSSTIGENTAEPEQEEAEVKEEKTPYNFAEEMKKLHEIREERKAEEPKVEETTSSYTEFNKVDEPVVDVVPTGKESSYVEFNNPSDDDFIDSSEDKVSFVDDNTEYVMEEPKLEPKETFVTKVIVKVSEAKEKLINKAEDTIAKVLLTDKTYQLYVNDKKSAEAAVKVKE